MILNYSDFSPKGNGKIVNINSVGQIDRAVPYHHQKGDGFIFEYVISGEECVESPDILLNAGIGDFIVVRPEEECVIYRKSRDLSAFSLHISGFVLEAIADVLNIDNTYLAPAAFDLLDSFLKITSLYDKYNAGSGVSGKQICEIAVSFLLDIAAHKSEVHIRDQRPTPLGIKNYLDLCICGDVDLEAVGKRFGVTGVHIIRIFRSEFDFTPMQYLKLRRLDKAAELLLESDLSIKDISSLLCFSSTQHFTNLFKEHFGSSPGKFRSLNKKTTVDIG